MKNNAIHRDKFKRKSAKTWLKTTELLAFLVLTFLIYNAFNPLFLDIQYATLITDKNGKVMHAFLSDDDKWRMYIEPEEISPLLRKAFILKEDKYFYYHPGVNPLAIARAAFNNVVKSKRTSGASTITMQVVRLSNPRSRTYANKFKEMLEAMQLEMQYSKTEILNMYLNLVPYGGNIEGVKAMSVLCLDKLPLQLSLSECVALSIIPNRPNSLLPGKFNDRITTSKNKWLYRYKRDGSFGDTEIRDALNEDFQGERSDAPKEAPHLSWRLKKMFPNKYNIRSTIDLNDQKKVEQLITNYSKSLSYQGIFNCSVMIIENNSRSVQAYVGSADFNDNDHAGQVDGITAIRSPGSTLKPFLFGLALDSGIITPKSKLLDVPINFEGYEPENYDGEFHGSVTASHALAHSLNIPAAKVLDLYTTDKFVEDLKNAGFTKIAADKNKLGLSLILGGCGVTLENLSGLYSSFSNYGSYLPIRYQLEQDPSQDTIALLSSASSYLLSEMLLNVARPDLPGSWRNTANLPAIAWKTGTSYGRKDAWSIGYSDQYTIGVWVGNFDGTGVPELSGAKSAAPLLFQLFNAIQISNSKHWLKRDNKLDYRQVCNKTGKIPSENCKNLIMDDFIPGISTTLICDHIKKVWVSQDSTMSYCRNCRPEAGYVEALYDHYPVELVSWFDIRHINYDKIPDHNPACERIFYANEPKITSPVHGIAYHIDIVDSTEISLACQVNNDVSTVYWYINDQFYQEAAPDENVFFFPRAGELNISCVDDKGRKTNVKSQVKYSNF